MVRYVALLRGINVGGNNLIKMPALKACFEKQGFADVVTYIQSGNVLFSVADADAAALGSRIEAAIAKTVGCQASAALRSQREMREFVGKAPKGFGSAPAEYRYDVIFLLPALTAAATIKSVPTAPGVDQAHAGKGVLYFSRLIEKASQSRLSRLVSMPIYKSYATPCPVSAALSESGMNLPTSSAVDARVVEKIAGVFRDVLC